MAYQNSTSNLATAKWNLLPEASVDLTARNDFYHPQTPGTADLSSSAGFSVSKTVSLNDPSWFNYKYAVLDEQKARLAFSSSASEADFSTPRGIVSIKNGAER